MSTSDDDLVLRLRAGDLAAYERAYEVHHAKIYSFLVRLTKRRDVAQDLHQETWMRLARSATRLDEEARLVPWLYAVARNLFVSWRRWEAIDVTRFLSRSIDDIEPTQNNAREDDVDRGRTVARLERALAKLSAKDRELLLLIAADGMEQADVASILGIRYDALRQRLTRARAALEDEMKSIEREHSKVRAGFSKRRDIR